MLTAGAGEPGDFTNIGTTNHASSIDVGAAANAGVIIAKRKVATNTTVLIIIFFIFFFISRFLITN